MSMSAFDYIFFGEKSFLNTNFAGIIFWKGFPKGIICKLRLFSNIYIYESIRLNGTFYKWNRFSRSCGAFLCSFISSLKRTCDFVPKRLFIHHSLWSEIQRSKSLYLFNVKDPQILSLYQNFLKNINLKKFRRYLFSLLQKPRIT